MTNGLWRPQVSKYSEALTKAMHDAMMTPEELAVRIGGSERAVRHYMKGDNVPHTNRARLIARTLGVELPRPLLEKDEV
jgi:ribosome-binding protein aMBF1 (putative translation factor)